MRFIPRHTTNGVAAAIGAAALFGLSTPLAKLLVGDIPPLALAGWLYAGSGIGLLLVIVIRHAIAPTRLSLPLRDDFSALFGAIFFGGVCGPALLMFGLRTSSATSVSLLLNLEVAFTALMAWFWFRENFDWRIALGMAFILLGGLLLTINANAESNFSLGSGLVIAACLCWAVDNNLTRKVSAADPLVTACAKGMVAGVTNLGLAAAFHQLPFDIPLIAWASIVGFLGYGLSLSLFVLALRNLGTARAGAYFSLAPFFGAGLAMVLHGDAFTFQVAIAATLMAAGVWLHLNEKHSHRHVHAPLVHNHDHRHDDHHTHHDSNADTIDLKHSHSHTHQPIEHSHEHFPDIHHRHRH
jgi:drug/metabolite transporter (DMT)-like permease